MTVTGRFYASAIGLCACFWLIAWFVFGPVPTAIIGLICVLMVFGLAVTSPP